MIYRLQVNMDLARGFQLQLICFVHMTLIRIESIKTTSMEDVGTGVLEKIKNI